MEKPNLITGQIIEETHIFSIDEFAHAIHVKKEIVYELVEYQLIKPQGRNKDEWCFNVHDLKRGRVATNFLNDLEINMPGVALALELLDRIEELELKLKTK